MDLLQRITKSMSDLSADPSSIDVSSVISLLDDVRKTIASSASGTNGNAGLSQPGAAQDSLTGDLTEKIKTLEKSLSTFSSLFEHMKNVVAGKIEVIYKSSPLKDQMLSDLKNSSLSIENFVKLQNQIDYQFNNAWFHKQDPIRLDKNSITLPQNYKSGGNKWEFRA